MGAHALCYVASSCSIMEDDEDEEDEKCQVEHPILGAGDKVESQGIQH